MKKIRKRVAGVIVVSMLVGSNITTLAVHNSQLNKINQSNKGKGKKISKLEKDNRSLRDEVFIKNNQLHSQQEEIKEYKVDIQDLKKKNEKIKRELSSVKSRPSKPTQPSVQVSRGATDNKVSYQMQMTSYTANCNGCSGITRAGHDARKSIYYNGMRVIATDPSLIPMHSIVRVDTVNGSFQAVAMDTGGAIKGNIIDLLVGSKSKALSNGRQHVTVTLLKKGGR
jgi:3D (Asp-Asp-Asp) domain-containing protein